MSKKFFLYQNGPYGHIGATVLPYWTDWLKLGLARGWFWTPCTPTPRDWESLYPLWKEWQ